MKLVKVLLVMILVLQYYLAAGRLMKMIYEKDMSEHCRRRVMPSVFLGRKVMEANARILQFSRLELPYNCFITVRSESGNNMVMMIQVMSKEDQQTICSTNEQLLVYEMGETFGGYWGPLPDAVLKREPLPLQVYTLKTTKPSTTSTTSSTEEEEEEPLTTPLPPPTTPPPGGPTGDYIEVVVPLANLSVHLEPGVDNGTAPDDDEVLDLEDDVTPDPGVPYDREILPLVQFKMVEQGRRSEDDGVPRYNLEYGGQDFTPDSRLTLPPLNPTTEKRNKQKYQPTKRLDFKKHRTLFQTIKQNRRMMSVTTQYSFPTTLKSTKGQKVTNPTQTQDSWKVVDDLLQKLSKNEENSTEKALSVKDATILEKISNTDHNKSVYLSPNLSIYEKYNNNDQVLTSTSHTTGFILNITDDSFETTRKDFTALELTSQQSMEKVSDHNNFSTEKSLTSYATIEDNSSGKVSTESDSTRVLSGNSDDKYKTNGMVTETITSKLSGVETPILAPITQPGIHVNKITTGSLVGHESWENVVQAAPQMAVLLNKSVDVTYNKPASGTSADVNGVTEVTKKNVLKKRKKRDIHSIAIENARPHNLTTKKIVTSTTHMTFNVGDMQEFAQLAELQDDEMHGRVALRYLRQFVGPPLFNLCDLHDATKPNVFLFNSSRIVLSLTNFSIERMVIILTAARALRSSEVKCPRTRLECQVAGARVCMDAMVACDGIPNCGSYDIYDEDRLLCGHTATLQKNVHLAAFTFLAVLLTVMYAVHYWLKRCVPKVADAFFVYSDGVENILYLDSVMRSPHDMEEPKAGYQSHMFGDDIYDDEITHHHVSFCQRLLRAICCCCYRTAKRKRHETTVSSMHLSGPVNTKRMYSFTELEIRKMLAFKDTAVQTGDSLLMNDRPPSSPPVVRPTAQSYDFTGFMDNLKKDSLLTLEEPFPEQYKDELSLIKFFKESRSDVVAAKQPPPPTMKPYQSVDVSVGSTSEQEIEIHTYERLMSEPGPSRILKNVERINAENEKINTEKQKGPVEKEKMSPQGSVSKHLRFDEVPVTIPAVYGDDDEEDPRNNDGRRGVSTMDKNRRASRLLDPIEEADEQPGGSKDHRSFWRTPKGKRNKKGQVSLR